MSAKPDAKGHWQVGYGFDDAKEGDEITEAQANLKLAMLIILCTHKAQADLGGGIFAILPGEKGSDGTTARQAALVDMVYELGQAGLARFTDMLMAIRDGDWVRAKAEGLASQWAAEVPSRAQRDMQMIATGLWPYQA